MGLSDLIGIYILYPLFLIMEFLNKEELNEYVQQYLRDIEHLSTYVIK